MSPRALSAIVNVDVDLADRRHHVLNTDQAIAIPIRIGWANVKVPSMVLVVVRHVGV